jgi:hypothetical protein
MRALIEPVVASGVCGGLHSPVTQLFFGTQTFEFKVTDAHPGYGTHAEFTRKLRVLLDVVGFQLADVACCQQRLQ